MSSRPSFPQVIPRPPDAVPGDPAPWAGLPDRDRLGLGLERVATALVAAGLTGPAPPGGEPPLDHPEGIGSVEALRAAADRRRAAVLVALFEEAGEARVLLTRRSAALRSHTSQVSFPGGRIEAGEGPRATALREAREEVGLDPAAVEVLGWLHPLLARGSRSFVVPVVGSLPRRPALVRNESEVARIFDVALADLVADGVFHEERWSAPDGGTRPVWFFEVDGETVWGATGRLLYELLMLVLGLPGPDDVGRPGA